jgi:hypothetical protein
VLFRSNAAAWLSVLKTAGAELPPRSRTTTTTLQLPFWFRAKRRSLNHSKSLAALVGLPGRLGCCLCRVSGTDYLDGAAGSRLRLDDFTFHGRGILDHVERCRRLADGLGRFSRECRSCQCENSDCRQKNLCHGVYRLSCVQYLNTGQTEPAGRGSSENGFVFAAQPKIVVPPRGYSGNNRSARLLASRHNLYWRMV